MHLTPLQSLTIFLTYNNARRAWPFANSFDDCRRSADFASQSALTLTPVKIRPAPMRSWQHARAQRREASNFAGNSVTVCKLCFHVRQHFLG
jgi:hypothetical protein